MLEGLVEFSIIKLSELDKIKFRVDAEFYQRRHLRLQERLAKLGSISLKEAGAKLDCSAFYPSITDQYNFEGEGIPFLRVNEIQNGLVKTTDTSAFLPQYVLDNNPSTISIASPYDIVIAKGGNSLAKLGLLPTDFPKYALSRDLIVMRTSALQRNKYFVWLFLHSCFGQDLLWRTASQTGQPHLSLPSIEQLDIPMYSEQFESTAETLYKQSVRMKNDSTAAYKQAETLLFKALNLTTYSPDTKNNSVKSFKESFGTSGRLDAEYYLPKFDEIEELIKNNGEYFKKVEEIQTYNSRGMSAIYDEAGTVDMITQKHILETGLDYDNFDKTDIKHFSAEEVSFVAENDILIYGTGANIGRSQPYLSEKKAVACQDIIILRVNEDPVYVAFVINSFIGRLQTDKMRTGSAQPHLYPKDIAQFLIPFVDKKTQLKIREKIISSLGLKKQSAALLETAKRAVEIAIEQDEKTGMAYIETNS